MAQLGRFEKTCQDTSGNAVSGASVSIFREGATVNGNQSGTTPLTVTVRNRGKIVAADTVFVNTTTGTTYTVDSVTATTVVISGFVGTLALTSGDRLIPSNSLPTLYSDDQAGATTANPLTSDSAGLAACWLSAAVYDVILSGGGLATKLFTGVMVGAGENTTVYTNNSLNIHDGDTSEQVGRWQVQTATGGVLAVGKRAQTTGVSGEYYLVYASESYTSDLAAANETFALYGINQISGAIDASADAHGVAGEVQFNASAAKAASGPIIGVQGIGRYNATHAGATASAVYGGTFSAICSGTGGTVTNFRSLSVSGPTNQGLGATVTNATSLFVQGPLAGVGVTQNNAVNVSGGTDLACAIIFNSCPVRIDDDDNTAGTFAAGRWIDIYRDWDGADSGSPLYTGVHMTLNLEGTFTGGDDGYGFRSLTRTGSVAGDGANLDIVGGYQSVTQHRSNQTVDELYGFKAEMTMSGAGTVNTMAGIDVTLSQSAGTVGVAYGAVLRSLTPSASFACAGHLKCVPVSLATPATTLAALTAEEEGTLIFVTDSNNADNSGWYTFMNGAWYSWTPGGVAAASDT